MQNEPVFSDELSKMWDALNIDIHKDSEDLSTDMITVTLWFIYIKLKHATALILTI